MDEAVFHNQDEAREALVFQTEFARKFGAFNAPAGAATRPTLVHVKGTDEWTIESLEDLEELYG